MPIATMVKASFCKDTEARTAVSGWIFGIEVANCRFAKTTSAHW